MKCVDEVRELAKEYGAEVSTGGGQMYIDLPDDKVWKANGLSTMCEPATNGDRTRWVEACNNAKRKMKWGTANAEEYE